MKKTAFVALLALSVLTTACTNGGASVRALQNMGMTDVELTGYRWFGCSKDDFYHDGFRAKSPTGVEMTGVVCGGPLKGYTVRFD